MNFGIDRKQRLVQTNQSQVLPVDRASAIYLTNQQNKIQAALLTRQDYISRAILAVLVRQANGTLH
jgi:uncharacterized membrane protein YkoI